MLLESILFQAALHFNMSLLDQCDSKNITANCGSVEYVLSNLMIFSQIFIADPDDHQNIVGLKIQPQLTGYTSDFNFTSLNYTLQQVLAYPLAVAKL